MRGRHWHGSVTPSRRGPLTGQHGGHERREHEEQHGEEQEARVAEHFLGFVADAQVEETDQDPDPDMGDDA